MISYVDSSFSVRAYLADERDHARAVALLEDEDEALITGTRTQAKGQEADYVVLLDAVSGSSGFPSTKVDDPVLRLLRPSVETFPHAEERRLLYVAMPRARRAVLLVTTRSAMSPFMSELSAMPGVTVQNEHGEDLTPCPSCGAGVLEPRVSAYGPFFVCSRRQCEFKQDGRRAAVAPAVMISVAVRVG